MSRRSTTTTRSSGSFAIATAGWGIVAFLVGLIVALKLVFPALLGGIPQLSYGRLRPLHTNAAIFAFAGNAIFVGVYYSLQRLCKARMFSDRLSAIHFWGWQLIIVARRADAAARLHHQQGIRGARVADRHRSSPASGSCSAGTCSARFCRRRERHMYVSIWFYLATFITVALLHVVNSLELPVSLLKSYSMYAGVQDALVQWWYGHNAVAFFLTTPFLGMMYYFIPKAANRPVFWYRLSIVHFWSLIFLYIWAGPHHLLYTALPDWAQSLGTVFSVMLIAPSWGGMVNGLLTLRGAWDRVREDPVLKFMVVGVTAYGMATFEGPMLSLKNVNALTHYTDYIIGHVHWRARVERRPGVRDALLHHSAHLRHDAVLGAARQRALLAGDARHPVLRHSDVRRRHHAEPDVAGVHGGRRAALPQLPRDRRPAAPDVRAAGGRRHALHRSGADRRRLQPVPHRAAGLVRRRTRRRRRRRCGRPQRRHTAAWHRALESRPVQFAVLTVRGGVHRRRRRVRADRAHPLERARRSPSVKPYTPLEIEGRDLYIREGCVGCHSQMIRPLRAETERYGDYSKAGRVRLRPSVPVGLQTHRARTCTASAASIPTRGTSFI